MKKVTFYFVRHGTTRFNTLRRLQGRCDSPLLAEGIEDAKKASLALRDIPFTRAYCSPAGRARQTAEIIVERHNVQLVELKDLEEFDFGELEGQCLLDPKIAETVASHVKNNYDFSDLGGENWERIAKRIHRAYDGIAAEAYSGETVLTVSHGSYGEHLIAELFGISIDELRRAQGGGFPIPNGSIFEFTWTDGKWDLLCLPKKPQDFVLWKKEGRG